MRLTHIAILAIRGSRGIVREIAEKCDTTPSTVYKWIRDNNDNLTKAAALAVIKEVTGLEDSQILEAEEVSRG